MPNDTLEETRNFWNGVADDWWIQVGHDGDSNRRLNSDPVLWQFAGDVKGLTVLDAGCGTGYLSKKLHDRGAQVTGIDFSERMIEIARTRYPDLDFRVDSCSVLDTIPDRHCDMVVANYVLMDTPDLSGTMRAFSRVLKFAGVAILIFSHPCFPQGSATHSWTGKRPCYCWKDSYFAPRKIIESPWAHFKSDFIWFHRPLSDYWKAFKAAGFAMIDFEEPRVAPANYRLAPDKRKLERSKTRPYSVAFKLQKLNNSTL